MKARINFIPVLFVAFSLAACAQVEQVNPTKLGGVKLAKPAKPGGKGAILKWLGTAGWEIRTGTTTILIDPFPSRKRRSRRAEWKTDEAAALKMIKGADYIFAGHSHHDHVGDIPFIAKRFGSKIIGSRTTTNLALTAGVDKSQVVTIRGGEKLDFKEFSVQVIESLHRVRRGNRFPTWKREIVEPFAGPIMGSDFVVGGSFLYYFTFGKHRVLHQSTPNFIETKLIGLRPDIALLGPTVRGYNLENVLKTLKPKVIIVHHFDEWRTPYSEGIPERNMGRAQRFKRKVAAVDNQIKVIIPDFFMIYTLEPSPKSD